MSAVFEIYYDEDGEEHTNECWGEDCDIPGHIEIPHVWGEDIRYAQVQWGIYCTSCVPKPLGSVRDMPVVQPPTAKA